MAMRDALRHLMARPTGDTANGPLVTVSAEPFSGDGLIYGHVTRHDTYRDALGQLHHPPLPWDTEAALRALGAIVPKHRAISTGVRFSGLTPGRLPDLYAAVGVPMPPPCPHCTGCYDPAKACSYCHGLGLGHYE